MKNSFREVGRSSFLTKKDPAQNAQDPSGLWVHRELVGRELWGGVNLQLLLAIFGKRDYNGVIKPL